MRERFQDTLEKGIDDCFNFFSVLERALSRRRTVKDASSCSVLLAAESATICDTLASFFLLFQLQIYK